MTPERKTEIMQLLSAAGGLASAKAPAMHAAAAIATLNSGDVTAAQVAATMLVDALTERLRCAVLARSLLTP